MMERLKDILLDFFENNIRRIFWGSVLMVIVITMWRLQMKEQAITLLVAAGGVAISQFQHNEPRKGATNEKPNPPAVSPGPDAGVRG